MTAGVEEADYHSASSSDNEGGAEEEENANSFHKFWSAVERLVQRLPAGVAFTMAQQPTSSGGSSASRDFSNPMSNSILLDSYYVVPPTEAEVK